MIILLLLAIYLTVAVWTFCYQLWYYDDPARATTIGVLWPYAFVKLLYNGAKKYL